MYIIHCIHIYIYHIYSNTYTYINLQQQQQQRQQQQQQQQQQQFSSVSLSLDLFFAPPPKTNQRIPGEDVMRVQQTETFEARLASPLLPFYATWQAVDSDRISTEKRKVVVMPKKRWGYYYRTPCQNGLVDKWVTGVLTPGM